MFRLGEYKELLLRGHSPIATAQTLALQQPLGSDDESAAAIARQVDGLPPAVDRSPSQESLIQMLPISVGKCGGVARAVRTGCVYCTCVYTPVDSAANEFAHCLLRVISGQFASSILSPSSPPLAHSNHWI